MPKTMPETSRRSSWFGRFFGLPSCSATKNGEGTSVARNSEFPDYENPECGLETRLSVPPASRIVIALDGVCYFNLLITLLMIRVLFIIELLKMVLTYVCQHMLEHDQCYKCERLFVNFWICCRALLYQEFSDRLFAL